jgi:uncharacterized protein (DUF488 family)
MPCEICTIGHGSRPRDELVSLLAAAEISLLVDVRAFPVSRRHPQFSRDALQATLPAHGIGYQWQGKAFGGFRQPAPHSPHLALKHDAFRGFADHMQSAEFRAAAAELMALARAERVALMCAERLPAQCHRNLIADFLTLQGAQIVHLLDAGRHAHRVHAHARSKDGVLVYELAAGTGELPF